MNKIFLIFCLVIGLATSFDIPDIAGMNSAVASVCAAITARPGPAATVIDRMQKMLNEKQQKIQQRFPRTFVYVTKQENKDKLKSGGDNCKSYFDGLKAPVAADLQNNKEPLQFMQQMVEQHMKDFINQIQQASG